jgi:hypothetical protein
MNKNLFIASITLLCISPLAAQSQSGHVEPYGFHDIHLGMAVSEFKVRHPSPDKKIWAGGTTPSGQTLCYDSDAQESKDPAKDFVKCFYGETYLSVGLRITTEFIDGKLAEIIVELPEDAGDCFDPSDPHEDPGMRPFRLAVCQPYTNLLQSLTGTLGQAMTITQAWNPNPLHPLLALRWENDVSVVEFQNHSCGPNGSPQGRRRDISELLEGQYCERSDIDSPRQSVMLYLDKNLGRTLVARLAQAPD